MYDYLIIGAGYFGSVFAYELTKAKKKVLVIDERDHIGGNAYTKEIEGINTAVYGPHILHTSNEKVWNYINQFAKFNHYRHNVKAFYKDKFYSLPINLNTFYQIAGCKTPQEATDYLKKVVVPNSNPQNLEEWALSKVGREIYEIIIKGYTKKQWRRDPQGLPASIIKRIPIRFTFDENYYNDCYGGIPIGGYTQIFERMLDGIKVELGTSFQSFDWKKYAKKLIFSGKIDEFFNYEYGELEYRTLRFESEILDGTYQGAAQINYTDEQIPFTRIVEHKHFEFGNQDKTVITREYPTEWRREAIPYYPINDDKNNQRYTKYKKLCPSDVIMGGRLASFKYMDMDTTIAQALNFVERELCEK